MYDKDGQNPLPQWALGPGATVWRTKILGHEYLLKKKKKIEKKLHDMFLYFFWICLFIVIQNEVIWFSYIC